jgi:hypothetical protein
VLGMFLQPDWFEVLQPGVGTNRFSYSFNDPVNKRDANGNTFEEAFSNFINSFFGGDPRKETSSARTEQNARVLAQASATHIRTMPRRAATEVANAYEYTRTNTVSGGLLLPDVAGAVNGDALEIIGMIPGARLPGKVLEGAIDAARVVCSFDGATLVLSERGLIPISSVQPLRDRVWSTDELTQQSAWNRVLAQSVASYDHEVLVTIFDETTGNEQTITSNRIHPYFAQVPANEPLSVASEGFTYNGPISGGRWIDAGDLKPGYRLMGSAGDWVEVIAVSERPVILEAWNLTVENYHSFYVAETVDDEAVWVHNSCLKGVLNLSDRWRQFSGELTNTNGKLNLRVDMMQSVDGSLTTRDFRGVLDAMETEAQRRGLGGFQIDAVPAAESVERLFSRYGTPILDQPGWFRIERTFQ